jgi:thioesterase domain-containing protein
MDPLLAEIIPAKALQITVSNHWKNGIELSAPLQPNRNDKGTAFAGSIESILTLTGWALITRELQAAGIDADVMVVKNETDFTAAVRDDFSAETSMTPEESAGLFQALERRGRGRLQLTIRLHTGKKICAVMTAHFAVIRR